MGLTLDMKVDFDGVFWDRPATDRILDDFQREALDEIALQTGTTVVRDMQGHFRAPRPYYWTTVDVEPMGASARRVTDHGSVVYNFWLEGIGSRNYPKTRFRGYGHWARTRRTMKRRASGIARSLLPRYVARLNA